MSCNLERSWFAVFVDGGETDAHSLQGRAVLRIHTERAMVTLANRLVLVDRSQAPRRSNCPGGAARVASWTLAASSAGMEAARRIAFPKAMSLPSRTGHTVRCTEPPVPSLRGRSPRGVGGLFRRFRRPVQVVCAADSSTILPGASGSRHIPIRGRVANERGEGRRG